MGHHKVLSTYIPSAIPISSQIDTFSQYAFRSFSQNAHIKVSQNTITLTFPITTPKEVLLDIFVPIKP